jgi:hypothetical protein
MTDAAAPRPTRTIFEAASVSQPRLPRTHRAAFLTVRRPVETTVDRQHP